MHWPCTQRRPCKCRPSVESTSWGRTRVPQGLRRRRPPGQRLLTCETPWLSNPVSRRMDRDVADKKILHHVRATWSRLSDVRVCSFSRQCVVILVRRSCEGMRCEPRLIDEQCQTQLVRKMPRENKNEFGANCRRLQSCQHIFPSTSLLP